MQATIEAVLMDRLRALQATGVYGPNANYPTTSSVGHLRAYHLPGAIETETYGSTRHETQRGVFQVSIFATLGKGGGEANAKVDALVGHFPTTWSELRFGVTVRIEARRVHPGQVDPDGWWVVPVDVAYAASRTVAG